MIVRLIVMDKERFFFLNISFSLFRLFPQFDCGKLEMWERLFYFATPVQRLFSGGVLTSQPQFLWAAHTIVGNRP